MEHSTSAEADCSHLVKYLALYRTCRVYKSPPLVPVLSKINAVHALLFCCFKVPSIVGHCRALFVATRSKAWVCWRLLAEILQVRILSGAWMCLLWILPVLSGKGLRRADNSSRGVLASLLCQGVISKPQRWGSLGQLGLSNHKKNGALSCEWHCYVTTCKPKFD